MQQLLDGPGAYVSPDGSTVEVTAKRIDAPKCHSTPAADVNDVMHEQLDFLIDRAQDHARGGVCGCRTCKRYLRVRAELMKVFEVAKRAQGAGA